MGATAPFWRFSASSYPDLGSSVPDNSDNTSTDILKKNKNMSTDITFNINLEPSSGVLFFLIQFMEIYELQFW